MKSLAFGLLFLGTTLLAAKAPNLVAVETVAPVKIAPGEKKEASVVFNVKKGFHVQSNPASEKYLIPTVLTLEPVKEVTLGKPKYPPCDTSLSKAVGPCRPHKLKGSKTAISTYEGSFPVKIPVSVAKDVKPGKTLVSGNLRYQACNDHTCFFPKTIKVSLPVEIQKP